MKNFLKELDYNIGKLEGSLINIVTSLENNIPNIIVRFY